LTSRFGERRTLLGEIKGERELEGRVFMLFWMNMIFIMRLKQKLEGFVRVYEFN